MAYTSATLSILQQTYDGGFNVWVYKTADSFATAKAANYFSDAFAKGVKARDVIYIVDTATPATTISNVLTVTSSTCTTSQTGVVIAE